MKQFSKNFKNNSFAKDVLKLVSGTTFAQILAVAAAPLLTRLYNPEDFGVSALFFSVISIISVIASLRYELSIMLPESDEEAANLVGVSLIFVILISILTIPIVALAQPLILDWLNAPQLSSYLWLISPMTFFSGTFLALNYWNSRKKHFGRLSLAKISQSSVTTITQIGLGYVGRTNEGSLIGARLLGSSISTLVLSGQIWHDDRIFFRNNISFKGMVSGLKRYYKFPLYNTWATLLNTISWQLPNIILSACFSPTVAGYYALSNRFIQIPMNFIGSAIAQVFFQRISRAKNEKELSLIVQNTFELLVKCSILPIITIIFIGQELFTTLFGEQWLDAGIYTQVLSVYIFFNFIASPLTQLLSVVEQQEITLIVNFFLLISRAGSLLLGSNIGNDLIAIILFSLSSLIIYSFFLIYILQIAALKKTYYFTTIFGYLFQSLIIFLPSYLIKSILQLESWMLVIYYCLLIFLYFIFLLKQDFVIKKSCNY